MSRIIDALRLYAATKPDTEALCSDCRAITWLQLWRRVQWLAEFMRTESIRVLALSGDNSIEWVIADLAAVLADVVVVPVPPWFTVQQQAEIFRTAGVDVWLSDVPWSDECVLAHTLYPQAQVMFGLYARRLQPVTPVLFPAQTAKISFTSGSTGDAKGVCLSLEQMENVVVALAQAVNANAADRHVCLLPLATLLENLAGVWLPVLVGAKIQVLPLAQTGLTGSSQLDVQRQLACLQQYAATTAILVPQMLRAQVAAISHGVQLPTAMRFMAVGGGKVAPELLNQAQSLGLSVYEGYGLSECASVVALNTCSARKPGSVGKPLEHVHVEIAADGEIVVQGSGFLGYLGDDCKSGTDRVMTGDIGYFDEMGFLHVAGRKKNLFITAFGRNVSPEWVESECQQHLAVRQIAVFGEELPCNIAVVVLQPGHDPTIVEAVMNSVNKRLPDYARIACWIVTDEPFSHDNHQLTWNGRLCRDAIRSAYATQLNHIALEKTNGIFSAA